MNRAVDWYVDGIRIVYGPFARRVIRRWDAIPNRLVPPLPESQKSTRRLIYEFRKQSGEMLDSWNAGSDPLVGPTVGRPDVPETFKTKNVWR